MNWNAYILSVITGGADNLPVLSLPSVGAVSWRLHLSLPEEFHDSALTIMRLKSLRFDNLVAVITHHQVEIIMCRTETKYWHICNRETVSLIICWDRKHLEERVLQGRRACHD